MSTPVTVGLVGSGWRAEFFLRLAALLPERLTLVGATVRQSEVAEQVTGRYGIPTYASPAELVGHQHPDFVVSSVPWPANPEVVTDLVDAGTRVLCETPPAPDRAGLQKLWTAVGGRDRVQVAEQYLEQPAHAARRELVRRGVIGDVTSVQVSSTHGYHAVSIMRGLLGAGYGSVTVGAVRFTAPLIDTKTRAGWTDDDEARPADTVLATLDFGDGRSGLYDFTDNQWHNQLRFRRLLVRGSRGEIANDVVVRLAAPRTIVRSSLVRSQLGYELDLDGYDTEHISFDGEVLYRNPFLGLRLMDEEISIATMLTSMAAWVREEGPAPYPLGSACQDHLVSLAIDEALESGRPVTTSVEAWAD